MGGTFVRSLHHPAVIDKSGGGHSCYSRGPILLATDFPRSGVRDWLLRCVLAALYADAAEILGMDREELIEQVLRNGSVFTD
jgi:hypothetical protein